MSFIVTNRKVRSPAIGIDFGTSYCCAGVFRNGKVEIIANEQGGRTILSYVAFTSRGRLFGNAAKNQLPMNPTNTVFDANRLIGRKFNYPVAYPGGVLRVLEHPPKDQECN